MATDMSFDISMAYLCTVFQIGLLKRNIVRSKNV